MNDQHIGRMIEVTEAFDAAVSEAPIVKQYAPEQYLDTLNDIDVAILFALRSQGVTSITAAQVRGQLYYDGSFYSRHQRGKRRRFAMLRQLSEGWFCWEWFEYNPHYDAEKGELEIAPVFPGQKVIRI